MTTEQGSKKRSLLKWLLVSLTVNLFLGGILAGHIYSRGFQHLISPQRPAPHMMRDLSPDSRHIVHDVFKGHSARVKALARELREEREDLQQLFGTEPFDEERARLLLAEIGRLDGLVQAEMHAATIEIARQLPAEERHKLNVRWKREHRPDRDKGTSGRMPPN